ncbi:hypothetical protein PF004_g7757 [Phytophthora fragariae]|uniref:Uncharacterized protein n=1 Tax=Phytophthora fragariae TaxID=53985 RepID=A0A6G0P952_9STRA|nr:hypothetical protein PF004_g7757 [Phytophthora fragariae]
MPKTRPPKNWKKHEKPQKLREAEEATYCAGEDIPQSSCQASFIGSFAFRSLDDKYGRRLMFIFMLVFFLMGHRALRHQLGRDLHHVRASRCSALLTCSFLGWRTSAATQRASWMN